LSTALAQKKTAAELVTTVADDMKAQRDLTLLAATEVSSQDLVKRQINMSHGQLGYSKLVIAMGADCVVLPIYGDGAMDILSVDLSRLIQKFTLGNSAPTVT
jgi:rubredoxin-NAD+ reductase